MYTCCLKPQTYFSHHSLRHHHTDFVHKRWKKNTVAYLSTKRWWLKSCCFTVPACNMPFSLEEVDRRRRPLMSDQRPICLQPQCNDSIPVHPSLGFLARGSKKLLRAVYHYCFSATNVEVVVVLAAVPTASNKRVLKPCQKHQHRFEQVCWLIRVAMHHAIWYSCL